MHFEPIQTLNCLILEDKKQGKKRRNSCACFPLLWLRIRRRGMELHKQKMRLQSADKSIKLHFFTSLRYVSL